MLGDGTDADVFALAEDELEAAVQVFHVRGGRVRGQRGWVVEKVEDVDRRRPRRAPPAAAVRRREAGDAVPARGPRARRCPPDADEHRAAWLSELRGAPGRPSGCRSAATSARCWRPSRRNAAQALTLHKTRRGRRPDRPQPGAAGAAGGARPGRGAAADRVLRRLATSRAPTSSPRWSSSRTAWPARASTAASRSAGADGQDDVAADARGDHPPVPPLPRRTARPAELDLGRRRGRRRPPTDAGDGVRRADRPGDRPPAQVRLPAEPRRRRRRPAAGGRGRRGRSPSSASTTSRCAGWPSGSRRSGCPAQDDPVILPRTSEGLYLLQRVRDEAHRFAITYHRQRRSQGDDDERCSTTSRASGETRRKALLRALRLAEAAAGRERRGDRRRCRASGRRGRGRRRRAGRRESPAPAGRHRRPVRSSMTRSTDRRDRGDRREPATATSGAERRPTRAAEPSRRRRPQPSELLIVTGMSGAGRSHGRRRSSRTSAGTSSTTCRRSCSRTLVELAADGRPATVPRIAVVVDVRGRAFFAALRDRAGRAATSRGVGTAAALPRGHRRGAGPPLRGGPPPAPAAGRAAGCSTASRRSASCSADLRADADLVIDTSDLNVHQLAAKVDRRSFGGDGRAARCGSP